MALDYSIYVYSLEYIHLLLFYVYHDLTIEDLSLKPKNENFQNFCFVLEMLEVSVCSRVLHFLSVNSVDEIVQIDYLFHHNKNDHFEDHEFHKFLDESKK